MKKALSLILVLLVAGTALMAQGIPKQVLKPAEYDKFLNDFPKIIKEIQAQGLRGIDENSEEAVSNSASAEPYPVMLRKTVDQIRKIPGWKDVLSRHGWNDRFWDYFYVSILAMYVVAFEQYPMDGIPPEMKNQMETSRKAINPDDLSLVRSDFERVSMALSGPDKP